MQIDSSIHSKSIKIHLRFSNNIGTKMILTFIVSEYSQVLTEEVNE